MKCLLFVIHLLIINHYCLSVGLSVTGQEEVLQTALNTIHSMQKNPAGIEQRLENCENVIRLLLQVQIAEFNSHTLEKKEDEVSINPPSISLCCEQLIDLNVHVCGAEY